MKKKILSVLLCLALGTSLLAGCGDSEKDDSKSGDTTTSKTADAGSGEKVKFHFANFFVEGQAYHDLTVDAVKRFNADNPNVEIILDEMPSDPYLIQINSLGTTDDLPELCMINGSMLGTFAETDVIIPMDELIESSGIKAKLRTGILEECTSLKDGKVYSVPIAAGTYGFIMYNEEIFAKAGVTEFPKTLDAFKAACDKIKAAGYIPMALGDKALWPADSLLFSSFVNNFVGNEWFNEIRKHSGKSSFNDKQFVDALTAFAQLAKDGTFNNDFVSIDNDERQALYTNGKAAMISAGDWECINVAENNADIAKVSKAAAWPAPAENAKANGSIEQSAAWGFAIGSKANQAQIDAIMKFLSEYVVTEEWGKTLIEEKNAFPGWNCSFDESKLSVPAASLQEAIKANEPCLNWDSQLPATVKEIYQRGLQEILIGEISPKELAKQMQEEYELAE